ncbi:MAG TPA: helix-turn-helix domain-containing protein [Moraxellaceae bacterium]|nr:helix-turn-helix domain-containing protein [Moraxellaceae bacterium]
MHYPVMTEQQVAARWKVSLKTMRRWRQDKVGPTWHKLYRHVRYHEADVFDFEQQSAQHWLTILGDRERVPRIVTHPPKDSVASTEQDTQTNPATHYVSTKEVASATGLPIFLFKDCYERERKRIPHLLLVGNLRFSMEAILQWELANSVPGIAPEPQPAIAAAESDHQPKVPVHIPRWYEVVSVQAGG